VIARKQRQQAGHSVFHGGSAVAGGVSRIKATKPLLAVAARGLTCGERHQAVVVIHLFRRLKMKLKYLMAIVGLSLVASAQAADGKELRIGLDPTYAPFEYKLADGKLVGFEVDLAEALCTEMKLRCVFSESSWDGLVPSLLAKKFDVIFSSMSMTEERKKSLAFTDKYYNVPSTLVLKRGSGLDGSPESLKGKRIGALKGSTHETYARKVFAPAGAIVVGYANTQDSYMDMMSGRVDALVANVIEVKSGLLSKPEGKAFEMVGKTIEDPSIFGNGVGGALRKQDTRLQADLNLAIKAIRANGTYKKLADKYFDFDVYGK
jgi:histidine transport system substrate-binding protein